ncbi:hypothetical protein HK099_001659, partial [Clydaea vesicula]
AQGTGVHFGFVEFRDHRSAEQAINSLNGTHVMNYDIRVNWAFAGAHANSTVDTSSHFHLFVGDLSAEVNDQILWTAFQKFGSLSEARVMWDANSGKSRGYGFVAFKERVEAEQALTTMNGEWIGSRPIRLNWANQKSNLTNLAVSGVSLGHMSMGQHSQPSFNLNTSGPLNYEVVVNQTSTFNTTVYVGNLPPTTTRKQYGAIYELKLQSDRGYAFVKMDTHENAAMAIVSTNGLSINNRPVKCSWGKDKGPENFFNPQQVGGTYPGYAYGGGDASSGAGTGASAVAGYYQQQQGLYNPSAYGYAGGWNQNNAQQYYNAQQQQQQQ